MTLLAHGRAILQLTGKNDREGTHMSNPDTVGPIAVIAAGVIVYAIGWLFGGCDE